MPAAAAAGIHISLSCGRACRQRGFSPRPHVVGVEDAVSRRETAFSAGGEGATDEDGSEDGIGSAGERGPRVKGEVRT